MIYEDDLRAVLEENNFLLIILDATRYDIFLELYPTLKNTLPDHRLYKAVWYTSCSAEFMLKFYDRKRDIVYVSANPYISHTRVDFHNWDKLPCLKSDHFNGSEYFKRVIPVHLLEFNEEYGTTTPGSVYRYAIFNIYPRMIVHFFQPHVPYRLIPRKLYVDFINMIKKGELTLEKVREAYIDNLLWVWKYTVKLVKAFKKAYPSSHVYITSDHGDIIDDLDNMGHPCCYYRKELVEVPFIVVY